MNITPDIDQAIPHPGTRTPASELLSSGDVDLIRGAPPRADDEEPVAPAGEAAFLAQDARPFAYADSEPSPASPPATRLPINSPPVSRPCGFAEADSESAPGSPPLLGLERLEPGQASAAAIQQVASPIRRGRSRSRVAPSQASHATHAEAHREGPGATQMDTQSDEADGMPVSPTIGQVEMRSSTGSIGNDSTIELLRRRQRVNPQPDMPGQVDSQRSWGQPPRQSISVQAGQEPPPYEEVYRDAADYEAQRRRTRRGHQAPRWDRSSSGASHGRSHGAAPARPSSNPARSQVVPPLNLANMPRSDSSHDSARSLPNVSSVESSGIGSDYGLQPSGVQPLAEADRRPLTANREPLRVTPPRADLQMIPRRRPDPQNLAAGDRSLHEAEDERLQGFVLGRDAMPNQQRPADRRRPVDQEVPHGVSQPLQPGVASSSADGAFMREPRRVNIQSPEAAPRRAASPGAPMPMPPRRAASPAAPMPAPPASHLPAAHPPAAHPAVSVGLPAENPVLGLGHASTMPAPAALPGGAVALPTETPVNAPRRTSTMGVSRTGANEFFTVDGALEQDLAEVMTAMQAEEDPAANTQNLEVSGRPDSGPLPAVRPALTAGPMAASGVPHQVPASWDSRVGPPREANAAPAAPPPTAVAPPPTAVAPPPPRPGLGEIAGLMADASAVAAEPSPDRSHGHAPPAQAPAGTDGRMPPERADATTAGAPEPTPGAHGYIPNAGMHGGGLGRFHDPEHAAPQHGPGTGEGRSEPPPSRPLSREPMLPPHREPTVAPLPQDNTGYGAARPAFTHDHSASAMPGLRSEAPFLGSQGPTPPVGLRRDPPHHFMADAGFDPRWPGPGYNPAQMGMPPPMSAFPPPGPFGPPMAPPGPYPGWGAPGVQGYPGFPMGQPPPPPPPQQPPYQVPPAVASGHPPPPQGANPGVAPGPAAAFSQAPGSGPADGLGAAPAAAGQRPRRDLDNLSWGPMPPAALPPDDLAAGLRQIPPHAVPPAPAHPASTTSHAPATGLAPAPGVEPAVVPAVVPGSVPGGPEAADHPTQDRPADVPATVDAGHQEPTPPPEQAGGEPGVNGERGTAGPVEPQPDAHGHVLPDPASGGGSGRLAELLHGAPQDDNAGGSGAPPNSDLPADEFFDLGGDHPHSPEALPGSDLPSADVLSPAPRTEDRAVVGIDMGVNTTPDKSLVTAPPRKRRRNSDQNSRVKMEEIKVDRAIQDHRVGITRHGRNRYPPLDHWKNEHAIVEMREGDPTGMPTVLGVHLVKEIPKKPEEPKEDVDKPSRSRQRINPISDDAAAEVQPAPAGERRRGRAQAKGTQGDASRSRSRLPSAAPKPKAKAKSSSRASTAEASTASPEELFSPLFSPTDPGDEQPHGEDTPQAPQTRRGSLRQAEKARTWTDLPLVDGSLHPCRLSGGLQNEAQTLLFDLMIPPQSFNTEEVIDESRVLQFFVTMAPDGIELVRNDESTMLRQGDHCLLRSGDRYLLRNNSDKEDVVMKMIFGKKMAA